MYHAALRISEVGSVSRSHHTIQRNQVALANTASGQAIIFHFQSYKHHKSGSPPLMVTSTNDKFCPVRAMRKYLQRRGNSQGPLFRHREGSPLFRSDIVEMLQDHIAFLGLNPSEYNTHSFRSGRATDLATKGHTVTQISLAGRWRTTSFKRYIKPGVIRV